MAVLSALAVVSTASLAAAQDARESAHRVPAPVAIPLGDEGPLLRALAAAERERDPIASNVAEGATLAGTTLPQGLEREFAERLEMPAMPIRITPAIARGLVRYHVERHARRGLGSWIRHAQRYRTRIEGILAGENLPIELLWVVAAESGFDPNDVSRTGAVGLWQLMPEAARTYGLRIDAWIDERRDPERASRAAARYLRDLRDRFGSWDLALAAYNMGYNGLLRAMRKYNTNDFDSLAGLEAGLPYETAQYVPRILAAAIASRNAPLFGIADTEPRDAAVEWEDAQLTRSIPLDAIAAGLAVEPAVLRALNPSILGSRTPPSDVTRPFALHIPPGTRARVDAIVAALMLPSSRTYRARYGESLDEIASRYSTTAAEILTLSGLPSDPRPGPGIELLVPDRDPCPDNASERPVVAVETVAHPPSERRRVFYRIGSNEDLTGIARALGVRREELLEWNPLAEHSRLQSGMWLQAYVLTTPVAARIWEQSDVEAIERGSEEFHNRAVEHNGRVRMHLIVRAGDSMERVARRYRLSIGSLARINRRSRQSALVPGETIVVYAPAEAPERDDDGDEDVTDTAAASEPAPVRPVAVAPSATGSTTTVPAAVTPVSTGVAPRL